MPIFPGTALPLGGNLVNLPISALPNAGAALPAAGIAFGIIGTNWNINLALQALATLGKTRTLARPEIVTVENNKAEISLGEEIPYATVSSAGTQVQFKQIVSFLPFFSHALGMSQASTDAVSFLSDRFAGKAATSNCGQF